MNRREVIRAAMGSLVGVAAAPFVAKAAPKMGAHVDVFPATDEMMRKLKAGMMTSNEVRRIAAEPPIDMEKMNRLLRNHVRTMNKLLGKKHGDPSFAIFGTRECPTDHQGIPL